MFEQEFDEGNGVGSRSVHVRLKAGFPGSPIHDFSVTKTSQDNLLKGCLDGAQSENADFGTISMDYGNGVPNITTEDFEANGKLAGGNPGLGYPATPFIPNLASPGAIAGSTNLEWTSITAVSPAEPHDDTPKPPGVGEGSILSPDVSSTTIGETNFRDLTMGSSG